MSEENGQECHSKEDEKKKDTPRNFNFQQEKVGESLTVMTGLLKPVQSAISRVVQAISLVHLALVVVLHHLRSIFESKSSKDRQNRPCRVRELKRFDFGVVHGDSSDIREDNGRRE